MWTIHTIVSWFCIDFGLLTDFEKRKLPVSPTPRRLLITQLVRGCLEPGLRLSESKSVFLIWDIIPNQVFTTFTVESFLSVLLKVRRSCVYM